MSEKDQRTNKQNKSMHMYFDLLAGALNDAGLDMKTVLKPGVEIPWTRESVKKHLWKPIQEIMADKESTADMDTKEPSDIYQVLDRHISSKFGVHVEWPCRESEYQQAMGIK